MNKTIANKPVFEVDQNILNMKSGFKHKLLCDGQTFATGSACVFGCTYCYVPSQMEDSYQVKEALAESGLKHQDVVIRRRDAIKRLEIQLGSVMDERKRKREVIYSSPTVDVAASSEMVEETIEACNLILKETNWDIRLLSKSPLIEKIWWKIDRPERLIVGVSTGTLDDKLARAIEYGTPSPTVRLAALHRLQDAGARTFGMLCPNLPQRDYLQFAKEMLASVRPEKCEHIWAEVMNARGESLTRTMIALESAGYDWESMAVRMVADDATLWEDYSRATFNSYCLQLETYHGQHGRSKPNEKFRFLQYVNEDNLAWWKEKKSWGAVLLGKLAE